MSKQKKKAAKKGQQPAINCMECNTQADCCSRGAWADIEEAKVISSLNLKGEFFQLERDKDFPSGYRIGTSYEDDPCSFLDPDGLCSIHKIDYSLKPVSCQQFPFEKGKVSPYAAKICTLYKSKAQKQFRQKSKRNP